MNLFQQYYCIIYVILQYIYLLFFTKEPEMRVEEYKYKLDDINHKLITYKSKPLPENLPKKVILFLSGSYELYFDAYVKKMVYDLQQLKIDDEYELVVFEKFNKTSITIFDDIVHYINNKYSDKIDEKTDENKNNNKNDNKNDNKNNKTIIEELIVIGFSSGGVVASHITSLLKNTIYKKKIIMYDTPWHVANNVVDFENYPYFRVDYFFYNVVYRIYNNQYNYSDIKQHLCEKNTYWKWNYGATELFKLVQKIENWDTNQLEFNSSFNFDQEPNIKIVNIKCKNDPIINHKISDEYLKQNSKLINLNCITTIEKNVIGHTSDMAFNNKYINDIIRALSI
jgi:hypothetical protein